VFKLRSCRVALLLIVLASLAVTALSSSGGASAGTNCLLGDISLVSAPTVTTASAPIRSTTGNWSSNCPLVGYYKVWLRDWTVISGPTWVPGSPVGATFSYAPQKDDVNHAIESQVNPCDSPSSCYGYVSSTDSWPVSVFSLKGGNAVFGMHDAGSGGNCLKLGDDIPNNSGTHGVPCDTLHNNCRPDAPTTCGPTKWHEWYAQKLFAAGYRWVGVNLNRGTILGEWASGTPAVNAVLNVYKNAGLLVVGWGDVIPEAGKTHADVAGAVKQALTHWPYWSGYIADAEDAGYATPNYGNSQLFVSAYASSTPIPPNPNIKTAVWSAVADVNDLDPSKRCHCQFWDNGAWINGGWDVLSMAYENYKDSTGRTWTFDKPDYAEQHVTTLPSSFGKPGWSKLNAHVMFGVYSGTEYGTGSTATAPISTYCSQYNALHNTLGWSVFTNDDNGAAPKFTAADWTSSTSC